MRNKTLLALLIIVCWLGYSEVTVHGNLSPAPSMPAPTPTPTPPLNRIKINHCYVSEGLQDKNRRLKEIEDALETETNPQKIEELTQEKEGIDRLNRADIEFFIANERGHGTVMDVRPFAINQTTGKLSFEGNAGRISLVHMNPFIYTYTITVNQQELVTTALSDALKLFLPPSLGSLPGLQSGTVGVTEARGIPPTKLKQIEQRLDDFTSSACKAPADPLSKTPACLALDEMFSVFSDLKKSKALVNEKPGATLKFKSDAAKTDQADEVFTNYTAKVKELQNDAADTYTTCKAAERINETLNDYNFDAYFKEIKDSQREIAATTVLANDLEGLVTDFKADQVLTSSPPIRCKGYNCVGQFDAYAKAALEVLGSRGRELETLRQNVQEMKNLYDLTRQMQKEEGWFARTSPIIKKFELSQATVSVNRTKISETPQGQANTGGKQGTQSGKGGAGGGTAPQPAVTGGESSEGSAPINPVASSFLRADLQSGTPTPSATPPAPPAGANNVAPTGQINEVVQIGRPRFMLSGGLVYSPLPRRTFQSVKGFARDAQGNPTGTGNANVIGFGENSSRRLSPMVLLNSRLWSFNPTSLFFSVGVSAKHDDNVDVEYLFGPSVSLLNDRALFTFGAYGGKTQNLVSDVKVGDQLPDDIGDAKLFRKSYTWKPGFSFSYSFSRTTKKSVEGTTGKGGSTASTADLRNELRIGNIPFNLAVGLAYTSLEQRTYDEIVGFARDRQGNLANGQTLTRIVGLTSSSNYRLTPLALLHSRLTHFGGGYDFYFSTGVTGKKTDNAFDIEYLLGGSVNLYQRRVFLTVGAFAGKQQILGGDFFEGAKLGQSQSVTIQNRYVWKPALAISYDISKIIPHP